MWLFLREAVMASQVNNHALRAICKLIVLD